ncbi:MAG: Tripartite tricarboxylate transporter family receptor [Ramlibacter sp.]|jgi:tripartite-type tricarboxylate transporter receptor subunit TctC|uniref:Bug family tripartite tricarboxylate transporter substrate binding protein n=1 Tax=Ramlibacter sp. TaxID=1917967 RepID=UPI0026233145|nr:tripartite tricarboxylate transporter substrate binding protein [Ramlibacter sp.]MDB5750839.1 Tripartite tricarboxylate transporter family receptor [Ramlibacter sp.]
MTSTRRAVLKAAAALPLVGFGVARAQQFPSKPIKIIVPASPGTSIDAMTRFVADPLAKRLKTPVVVDNRSGAGGLLGYTAAAKSAPDGYTLILTGIPLYLLPLFSEAATAPFDPLKDFAPVARVARVSFAIVVGADSPHKTMVDLVRDLKGKPGDVTYSSQGVGSSAHLCSVILTDLTKAKAQHIGYKDSSTALTDVAGGRVNFTCQTSTGVLGLIQSGRLRALAVTGTRRWDELPHVPTVAEAVPGFEVSSQLDFMAPADTPEAVLRILSDEIVEIAQTPEFKAFCRKQVIVPDPVGSRALRAEMVKEAARWKAIAQLARS